MTRIGNHEFDHERYVSDGDVLYLSRGPEQSAASTFATPEGHAVRLDEAGEVSGLTIVIATASSSSRFLSASNHHGPMSSPL